MVISFYNAKTSNLAVLQKIQTKCYQSQPSYISISLTFSFNTIFDISID